MLPIFVIALFVAMFILHISSLVFLGGIDADKKFTTIENQACIPRRCLQQVRVARVYFYIINLIKYIVILHWPAFLFLSFAAREVFGILNAGTRTESAVIHPRKRNELDVVIKSLRIIVSDVIMAIHGTEYVRSKTASF